MKIHRYNYFYNIVLNMHMTVTETSDNVAFNKSKRLLQYIHNKMVGEPRIGNKPELTELEKVKVGVGAIIKVNKELIESAEEAWAVDYYTHLNQAYQVVINLIERQEKGN